MCVLPFPKGQELFMICFIPHHILTC